MDVGTIVVVAALSLTTLAALVIGHSRSGLSAAELRRAAGRALDCIGLGLMFYAANLGVGLVVVFALRAATGFVTFYVLTDTTILIVSLLQGLVVQSWRARVR